MTIKRLFPALLAVVFILYPLQSQAQKTRKVTKAYLQLQVDSLRFALDEMTASYQSLRDSLEIAGNGPTAAEDAADRYLTSDQGFITAPDNQADLDSLLSVWYVQRNTNYDIEDFMDLDSTVLVSNVPDSVYVNRLNAMASFIPLPYNSIIRNHIIRYTEKMPKTTSNIIGLSLYWMPQLEEVFDRYGLPQELKAMAVIESALKPTVVSRAGAKGMWQFMYTAARQYNLNITSFVDERLDPLTAADAAARYLKDSYNVFGDWLLAISSYNCGPGNVNKAIRRAGGNRDFWAIYPYLPRETRGYVPAFVAALYTLKYYPEHNIIPTIPAMPAQIDTFHINRMVHFEQIAHYTGASVEEIKDLNPQYTHQIIPGNEREYVLKLPYQYTNAFVDNWEAIPVWNDTIYFNPTTIQKIKDTGSSKASAGGRTVHKVRKGETLSGLAAKYHTTVAKIKKWNNLKSNTIKIGQRIIIYR